MIEKKIDLISNDLQRTHSCSNCGIVVNCYLKYELNCDIIICKCLNNSIKTKYV